MSNNTTITLDQLRTMLNVSEAGNNSSNLNIFSCSTEGDCTYSFSFGFMRCDAGKDPAVQQFLLSNGFNQQQIDQLSKPGGLSADQLEILNDQLQAIPKDSMDDFIDAQLQNSITQIDSLIDFLQITNPEVAQAIADSPELQMRIAIYENKYHMNGYGTTADPNSPLASYLEGVILTDHRTQLPQGKMDSSVEQLNDALTQFMFDSQQQGTSPRTAERTGTSVEQHEGACPPAPIQINPLGVNPPSIIYDMPICEGLF